MHTYVGYKSIYLKKKKSSHSVKIRLHCGTSHIRTLDTCRYQLDNCFILFMRAKKRTIKNKKTKIPHHVTWLHLTKISCHL